MRNAITLFTGCIGILTIPLQAIESEEAFIDKMVDDGELNTSLLDMSAAPSSIVGGCVNVISGNYFESTCDLIIPGANPLILQRSFNSGNNGKGTLCHGWDLNFGSKIISNNSQTRQETATVKDRGVNLRFQGSSGSSKVKMRVQSELLRHGITNCSGGVLSSRTNIKNKKLDYKRKARHCELYEETGEILFYHRTSDTKEPSSKYSVSKCLQPNKCSFTYEYDSKDRLKCVRSRGQKGNALSFLEWQYPDGFKYNPKLNLVCSDGRKILYKYEKQKSKVGEKRDQKKKRRYCLTSVKRDHAPNIRYEYRFTHERKMERMVKKSLPDNRYLQVDYYEKGKNLIGLEKINIAELHDSRVGRVSAIYAPVGVDTSPILIWSIKYNLHKEHQSSSPFGGKAEVTDALGHKKIYQFSDEERLTSIAHFLDDGRLYRKEKMIWAESGDEKTFLLAQGLTDNSGMLLIRRDYHYDEDGNVQRESLRGNLTGQQHDAVHWSSYKEAEKYSKTYTYTNDGLLKSENDGRKKTLCQYQDQTNLLRLKLIQNNEGICERYSYVYDSNCTLIKEISDDGNSTDIKDLSGVTERHIIKITPTRSHPIGLPEIIEELVIDMPTGNEVLLSRKENAYSKEGYLLRQNTYDSNGTCRYSKEWAYDNHGNILKEIDPLGQVTTYAYDSNDNRIFQQTPNQEFYTIFTYDYVNRLIAQKDIFKDGLELAKSYAYDYMGNRIACTDQYGNTTKFRHDEFGRLIEKIYPSILDVNGELVNPVDRVAYDGMNNPCEKIDSNGNTTKVKHTSWGKPYLIEYPDGTVEKNVYHVDGTLEKSIDVNGVETRYVHDYKGRKTSEEKLSPEGEQLSLHQWIYNAYHLIAEVDPAGCETNYTYDSAGRLAVIKKGNSETRYVYDNLGRKTETWKMVESGVYQKSVCQYDNLDRVTAEAVMDESGAVFMKKSYMYDAAGNRTQVIIDDDQGPLCTRIEYNHENKPVKVIQPDGTEAYHIYHYDYRNELGQTVASEEQIDAKGNRSIKILDACGRLAKEEKKDSFGKLLQRTFYIYDGEGNLIRRSDDVLINGEAQKSKRIDFLYDSRNRETFVIEAAGDPLHKISQKEYHPRGELAKIIKPDGVILFHEYDHLGRLVDLHSSDGSVHYMYTYDQSNNVVRVDDCIFGLTTHRSFDEDNRLVCEILGTGLKFFYTYDAAGRVTQVMLPDMSSITYSYDAMNLRSVEREKNGESFHCDYQYFISGKIAKIDFSDTIGSLEYKYDCCLRPIRIESRNWLQVIPENGYDPCGNLVNIYQKDAAGELKSEYSYDGLHHLVSETGAADHTYSYDSLHNRLSKDGDAQNVNILNQLIQQGDKSYEYDLNGNRAKKRSSDEEAEYRYDALDRLIAVIYADRKTEYHYDSFNRRLMKRSFQMQDDTWIEAFRHTFLYQGDKEIGALDTQGRIIEMRTLGLGNQGEIGATIFLEIGQQTFCPIHDFRGNIAALVEVNEGNMIECYRYSAFGEEQIFDGYGNLQGEAVSPWRFSSKRVDPETGWSFFGRRYYDPEIGKWTTPDPLGFQESPNIYCFVRNRPMMFIDPDGRFSYPLIDGEHYRYKEPPPQATRTSIGEYYELWANCLISGCMKEYGGEEYHDVRMPHEVYSCRYKVGTPSNNGLGICFNNGMMNSEAAAKQSAKIISDMAGGQEVMGVYNATYGPVFDVIECALGLAFGLETPPVKLTQENWDECAAKDVVRLLQVGHSQGMIHTRNAGNSYKNRDFLQKIDVMAIAPGAHVEEGVFGSAVHYESSRDFVPWFDWLLGGTRNSGPIVKLNPHPNASWWDHPFDSDTYSDPMNDRIHGFLNSYGTTP